MAKVLIIYPDLFNCYSKFFRKVEKIIISLDEPYIVLPADHNNIGYKFSKESKSVKGCIVMPDWSISDITHAIIFDDGEEFSKQATLLRSHNVPLRLIAINITRVINIKTEEQFQSLRSTSQYEYIGRGSSWGNPYSIYEIEDLEKGEDPRERVLSNYKYDFENNKLFRLKKEEVNELAGKRLGCFCKPLRCHGDILADFLNQWDDGK